MTSNARTRLLLAATVLLGVSTTGCQVLTWAFVALAPKPTTPAQYEFDKSTRLLVFPDNSYGQLDSPAIRDQLADKLNRELERRKLVAETVPFDTVRAHQEQMDRQFRHAEGRPAPLSALAEKVGADAVLYIDIHRFGLRSTPGEPIRTGRMTVMVRVVDAEGRRLWPSLERAEGYPLNLELPPTSSDSSTYDLTLTERMAERMAKKIARLFYAHRGES